jgi:cyclic pyranopterin phosphate synthase
MAEDAEFLPKSQVLTLEEIERLCAAFIRMGVRKLRLTGGEPLVRRGVTGLVRALGAHLGSGALDELTLTTNGTQLARHAQELSTAGVRRINVSLDSLDAQTFRQVTRGGDLARVLEGLEAAKQAGLAVKINAVALRGVNDQHFDEMIAWCGRQDFDLSLIETMPLGDVEGGRSDRYLPLDEVRRQLQSRWTLIPSDYRSGGPARYVTVMETGRRLGFITPMTHDFCASCNRMRVTTTGRLYPCLGHEQFIDLLPCLRAAESDEPLEDLIKRAVRDKPRGHDFVVDEFLGRPKLARHMNVTGG